MNKFYHLLDELTLLFDLECELDTVLPASMYFINQAMVSERASVFLYQPWNRELTVLASLDLAKGEVRIPKTSGVTGWVFEHREPVFIKNAYADGRFFKEVDAMTGFRTQNIICFPLIDHKNGCLGTLQLINKKSGDVFQNDLDLLNLIARMIAVAINNNRRYGENRVISEVRKRCIDHVLDIDNGFERPRPYRS